MFILSGPFTELLTFYKMKMKKIYFLFLLSCLSYAAFAQTTVTIYATGAMGSFVTGRATSFGTRNEGNIVSTSGFATSRGYAVFDLSVIPPGAAVSSCIIGFNVASYTGSGTPAGWATYGYAGDLSTVTVAATLYANMIAGTLLTNATYGTAAGDRTLASTAATTTFVEGQIGNRVSICWTGGANRSYTITGEAGAAALTSPPAHAPYLQVTYTCAGVSGVSAVAAPSPVCAGATETLAGNAIGASTYLWSGPGGYTSTLQSSTFTTTAASSGTYTFAAYNGAGCGTEATTIVSVSPTPVATVTASGNVVFCPGGNVVLTGPAGTGYTYQWYDSGAAISGETNDTYMATGNGSITVLVTGPNGCSDLSSPIATAVLPPSPPISPAGTADLCIGGTVTLSVATGGVTTGVTYQWLIDGAPLPGATGTTYTTGSSGTYNVVLSVPGCDDTSTSTVVTVYPPPNPVISWNAGTGLLSVSSSYATYQWFLNSVAIPGATSYILNPPDIGTYRVTVADPHGCSNFSAAYILNALSVNEIAVPEVEIYPNPAASTLHITSTVKVRAVISSIEGKKITDQPAATDIDVSSRAQGLYLITLYNEAGDRIAIRKFTKE